MKTLNTVRRYVSIANAGQYKMQFENFKKNIFVHTLRWEGGGKLHNVKGDSGGWTIWGIAYNYNKKLFENFEDFRDTTYEEAAAIAFVKYFLSSHADKVPPSSQLMYFDMAYNMGVIRAIKIAQKCVNVTADGIVGPITKSKLCLLDEDCLYKERSGFYNMLVRRNRKFQKFIKGWMNRTNDIYNK